MWNRNVISYIIKWDSNGNDLYLTKTKESNEKTPFLYYKNINSDCLLTISIKSNGTKKGFDSNGTNEVEAICL